MSFAVWRQKPPFAFGPSDAEQIYPVGNVWVVTDDPTRATQAAVDAVLNAKTPDVAGFITDAKSALGGIVAASKIIGAQAVFLALQSGNFADAQALIADSHASALTGGLSDTQYAGIKSLVAKYNLPITLA